MGYNRVMSSLLENCRTCGSELIAVKRSKVIFGGYYFECQKCKSDSWSCHTESEAIESWNYLQKTNYDRNQTGRDTSPGRNPDCDKG